jgi:hypothetical protein
MPSFSRLIVLFNEKAQCAALSRYAATQPPWRDPFNDGFLRFNA